MLIRLFQEIRLRKVGDISEQGFPSSSLVEKLVGLGEKAVAGRRGFVAAYRKAERGLQVISEIDFDTGEVSSDIVDLDALVSIEDAGEPSISRE